MTAQAHEQLILDGAQRSIAYCPPLPDSHPRVVEVSFASRSTTDSEVVRSTACWRRYIGSWEIRDDRFFLTALIGCYRLTGREPLFADWFTGVIRVPLGAQLLYVHMGFASVHEQEIHIRIVNGVVVARRTIDNRGRNWNATELAMRNFPGGENVFDGDDYWD